MIQQKFTPDSKFQYIKIYIMFQVGSLLGITRKSIFHGTIPIVWYIFLYIKYVLTKKIYTQESNVSKCVICMYIVCKKNDYPTFPYLVVWKQLMLYTKKTYIFFTNSQFRTFRIEDMFLRSHTYQQNLNILRKSS